MYSLQSMRSLHDGNWEGVSGATNIQGAASGTLTLIDTQDHERRHYRIKVDLLSEENAFPDADFDGMPNEWEDLYGLDPYNPCDAADNPDGDAYNNLEEYRRGTDPTVADPG